MSAATQGGGLLAEIRILARAVFDREVPWYARLLVVAIVAYILSPIDLIPDFIPVLGLLDEVVLVPLGVKLAIRLLPAAVLDRYREQVDAEVPRAHWLRRIGIGIVIILWLAAIIATAQWLRTV